MIYISLCLEELDYLFYIIGHWYFVFIVGLKEMLDIDQYLILNIIVHQ